MMLDRRTLLRSTAATLLSSTSPMRRAGAQSGEGWYPLKGDDGKPAANMRLPVELTSEIDQLSGVIWVGTADSAVTLYEFYDYNCPYCRVAATDLPKLMQGVPDLRLGLVNNAILGPGSVQASKVELAILRLKGQRAAYDFYHALFETRGAKDGLRALSVAERMGVSRAQLEAAADSSEIARMLSEQVRLAADLGLAATPSFVAGTIGVLGYPGPKALAGMVASLDKCGEVICPE
jgi:protein-disulfide isomerase